MPALGSHDFQCVSFLIPRLALLEIERRYNETADAKAIDKLRKHRLAMYAVREILFLKDLGVMEFLPNLDLHTLESFSRIAGEKFTDAWIRREISNYLQPGKTNASQDDKPVIFATCDLMNALAASAEGLDVFFFSRSQELDHYPYISAEKAAELIIDLAVSLGHIEIGAWKYDGMWSGKTLIDWKNDSVRATKMPSNPAQTG